jgi:hypothetical protein
MKSSSAQPGGLLKSKPTWSNTFGCSATSAFFVQERSLTFAEHEMIAWHLPILWTEGGSHER